MSNQKPPKRGFFFRIESGEGIVGRTAVRAMRSVAGIVERARQPERSKDEAQPTTPRMSFIAEPEPELPEDPAKFKANLVDRTRTEKQSKRTRVL